MAIKHFMSVSSLMIYPLIGLALYLLLVWVRHCRSLVGLFKQKMLFFAFTVFLMLISVFW